MKKFIFFLCIFILFFFNLFCEHISEITIYDSSLNKLKGDKNEIAIIENFSFNDYDVYEVSGLGSYYR
jgi:hypothetical protein